MVEMGVEHVVKVANDSPPKDVAAAIAGQFCESSEPRSVKVRAIGCLAVEAAVESVSIAKRYLAKDGFKIGFVPGFEKVIMEDGKEMTAVVLKVVQYDKSKIPKG